MSDMDKAVERTLRQIRRAKIEMPRDGLVAGHCDYSRTGWALQKTNGACTCRPTPAPAD